MQEILQQLSLMTFQKPKYTVSDFRARVSVLLDSEEVLKIQEALYSLRLCDWLKKESLIYYSQKMSKDFSTMTTGEPSERSSEQWMNWGTMSNGRYVTVNIGFPKTGRECSLSDIIEGGGSTKAILPLDLDYSETNELQRHDPVSNTIAARKRDSVGIYPIDGGGLIKVNGYHKG